MFLSWAYTTVDVLKVYFSRDSRRYIVKTGGKTITIRIHMHAHEYIAKTLPDGYRFYFVIMQPDVREKTRALLALLKYLPDLRGRIGVLTSFATIRLEVEECLRLLKEHGVEVVIDSGAFHVLNRKIPLDQYLRYLEKYVQWLNSHPDLYDWAVTMDIPCDTRPHESIQKMPNRWKIEKTVENTIKILDMVDDPRRIIAVVQGYTVEEYLYCCDLMKQHGIVTARTGVGSLCVRKYDGSTVRDVAEILSSIKRALPGWVRLHAFGINIAFLKHEEIRRCLASSDSDAWVYPYSKFARMYLYSVKSLTFKEIDTTTLTRHGKKITLDLETIYFYCMLSYIFKLRDMGVL